ncbi:hypothetical protein GGR51DRAFT_129437 [Nemania sp. FL0031]|nr:hypothetical protein GGR51DRAFT_129437 [Nemania sp. FL0031]
MLSLKNPSFVAPTAQELLTANEDWLVQFLNDCRSEGDGFDISRVVGVDGLSNSQRKEFSTKLSAAAAKAGPLNTNELSRSLGLLTDGQDDASDRPSSSRRSQSGCDTSTTVSPVPPENNNRFETFCHDELVKAGGRPAASVEHIFCTPKDTEASRKIFAPWLDDIILDSRDGDVPSLFSTQLEDWMAFQQKWQWDNRGRFAGEEGFSAYLEWERRLWLHKGQDLVVSAPSFEHTTREIWKQEERFLERSGKDGFAAYARAVEKRLVSHGFTQAFRLTEDPRRQDARSTWIEYLAYVYWWHDRHVAAMQNSEPQYRRAWDELLRFAAIPVSQPSPIPSTEEESLDEELRATKADLEATKADLEATRQQVNTFVRRTRAYQQKETRVRRCELRAQWVLEQLPLIEAEREVAECDTSTNAGGKRKSRDTDDTDDADDAPANQPPKRRKQEVSHGNLAPDLKSTSREAEAQEGLHESTAPRLRRRNTWG